MADGQGFEPWLPFGKHAFQACALDHSATHPETRAQSCNRRNSSSSGSCSADVKFAEVRVDRAHWIETHLINDRFDLNGVVREERNPPLRIVEAARAGDELFHFASVLAADRGVSTS